MNIKQKVIILISAFLSMSFVGLFLNIYLEFEDNPSITLEIFNKILLKSVTISFVILLIIVLMNRKKIWY